MERKNLLLCKKVILIAYLLTITSPGYTQQKTKMKESGTNSMSMKAASWVDTATIERIMGMKGKSNNGEYKITIPQNDLSVMVDGFKIVPAMGLGTWVAFTPAKNGVMMMGDLVVTETDLGPVQQEIIRQGLTSTAIHNHFIRNHPNIMYMHLGGSGNVETMAQKAKAVLDKVKEVRGADPSQGTASSESVQNTLDTKKLDAIIGHQAEMSKGVYKYTIGRPDVKLTEHGVPVSTFLGFNTWAAFQGTPEKAAVAGDFTMLENEVEPVLKALIENGIEVVALHNHMVHEQPRIFFLHYWGVGPAEQLAKGLRAALDQTGKKLPMHNMKM
ncbi:MAG: DUF1259 domain-containing protein [Flavisolibacter sp.]|nr:DUF1259 domain-containing protein [Flavisolibacter sp.]